MRYISSVLIAGAMFCLLSSSAYSQEQEEERHFFVIQTWKVDIPEDGTRAELGQLMKEWAEKITRKNDKIISERVLIHNMSSDSRDMIVITEYASWNDIDAAQDMQGKLLEAAYPDEEERRAFNREIGKYFSRHSDEIFRERPAFGK